MIGLEEQVPPAEPDALGLCGFGRLQPMRQER